MRGKKKKSRLGDCYESAGSYLLDNPGNNLRLVHAEVAGQGPLEGTTFGHAFVMEGNEVIDMSNGRNIRMPFFLYSLLGRIQEIDNFHVYDENQAREKIIETGHWGPWDLKTRSGL